MDAAVAHAFFSAPDPLATFCRDAVLWGPLAGDERLEAALRTAHWRVQSLMGQ
jgi:D-arabinitol 4-dehydrogenase